ncbi:aminopeptidase [Arthrobacter sp. MYb23]|uniref:P1 family peptidase n=1 Tax=unclassified Arthrobacter TaxID=235627 RepID=UPI000CFD531D|nr:MULTISPECIES: P1 family peptidase [unclassified Arthrobacter]PRB35638.1 aminopeptidase [Arthrobacter sp. MYb51]PRB94238.1 aminopeptidase [Arthrobacter sp. MYb23]
MKSAEDSKELPAFTRSQDETTSKRARNYGLSFGKGTPGPTNSLVDVEGVLVGHATLTDANQGIHSGVTAVVHRDLAACSPLPAGFFAGNGYGKFVGATQIQELGTIETPILLTSTLSTFRVADSLITWLQERNPTRLTSINPVIGEINDSWLSLGADRPVTPDDVFAALNTAGPAPVDMGNKGGGTGACALGFKAGIGSASREVTIQGSKRTVGVLVQANMAGELRLEGTRITPESIGLPVSGPSNADGSCVVVVATDFPCSASELARIARRGVFGLGRTGAAYSHGSGDYAVSFTTQTAPGRALNPQELDEVFDAVMDSVEESVLDAILSATTVSLPWGRTAHAFPHSSLFRGSTK